MSLRVRIRSLLLVCLFLVSIVATVTPGAAALPTPGFNGEAAEAVTGRVFPEAFETNDYIGYFEAVEGLQYLAEEYPGRVVYRSVGESYGLKDASGTHQRFEIPIVEVTNPDSSVPDENKVEILYMLSIHGNEKGGREGGLRVIEDFAKNIGMAQWKIHNGAGNVTYNDLLDHMRLVFLFPNPDGWAHDEPQFLTSTINADNVDPTDPIDTAFGTTGCANGVVFYCRTNGRNVDLNREVPTQGWYRARYTALSEPEAQAFANFVVDEYQNLVAATDIHGMLNDDHFVLTMMPAGQADPYEMFKSTRLAEMLKERLNNDDHFSTWTDSDDVNPAGLGVWGGAFNEWGTVWDAIGYTDSGFNGDWFFQDQGLNVPGFDIELAYNHLTFDSQYELGMYFNDFHIRSVRQIVGVLMDGAAEDFQTAIEVSGTRTAYVANPVVVTSADDEQPLGGWAAENPFDDKFDYAHNPFFASANDYWTDLKPFVKDGDVPAVLDELNRAQVTPAVLSKYDNLVIPGSAIQQIQDDSAAIDAIRAWTEAGGNLVLTDSALEYLELAQIVAAGQADGDVYYAGYTDFYDRTHPLVSKVRGIARQTYEPVPLGFSVQGDHAPIHFVNDSALPEGSTKLGSVPVPTTGGGPVNAIGGATADDAQPGEERVNLGEIPLGEGTIRFIGALLPDPSEEDYHPYGLASYATTYSGNQLLRSMLGWEQTFEAPPALLTDLGIVVTEKPSADNPVVKANETAVEEATPGVSAAVTLMALLLGLVAATLPRRRRD